MRLAGVIGALALTVSACASARPPEAFQVPDITWKPKPGHFFTYQAANTAFAYAKTDCKAEVLKAHTQSNVAVKLNMMPGASDNAVLSLQAEHHKALWAINEACMLGHGFIANPS